jgi:outer membrane protein
MEDGLAKKIAVILMVVATISVSMRNVDAAHKLPVVNVAIIADGPSERVTSLRALFLDEIRTVNRGEFNIQAPADLQLEGDRTLKGVRVVLDQVLNNPKTDLVVTLGVLSSHAAAMRAKLPKPVVAPLITNLGHRDLPYKDGTSGKHNLSYVTIDVDIQKDLIAFRKIVPFTHLAFLIDGAIADAIPGISDEVTRVAHKLGITITPVTGRNMAAPILSAIPKDTQAVYVGPLPDLSPNEYQQLVAGLIKRRLPSFAFEGKTEVKRGLLIGNAPAVQMDRLARRVALNARRILLGEDAAKIPVAFARAEGLTLNMRTARAIGFSPSWQLLTRAELLYEEPGPTGPPLTLTDAVTEALKLNLNLRISQSNVSAGKEDIRQARSALLPQIGITGNGINIDKDVAAATPGRAERTTSGSLTVEQILYSEPAWANLDVQKQLQSARISKRDQIRLDIVLKTAQTYLDVLRAKTNVRVQKDKLRLSRSNLDMARARRRIGTAGPSEVYRWESEIANAERAVVEAQTQTKVAEIALNAILHRPLEKAIHTVEVGLKEPELIASQKRLYNLIDNPASFDLFRDFIVQDALDSVPALHRLDALILAQERTLQSAQRAYWQPTLSLRADRTETFSRDGAQGPPLPGVDDSETTVAMQLSLPLFTSGSRSATKTKAREELTGLRTQHQAIAEQIEQRIRTALEITRSSYTAIRLSKQAADAAENNFIVVRDAYSRGTESILGLLDAQNAALVADLRAATAVYDFLRSLMEVERAADRFDFFLSPQEQAEWFDRVDQYFAKHGMSVSHH